MSEKGPFIRFNAKKRAPLVSGAAFLGVVSPVFVSLLGSRALSKVPVGPIYFYDVVLLVSGIAVAFAVGIHLAINGPSLMLRPRMVIALCAIFLLPLVSVLVLGTSESIGYPTLRDAAPFVYLSYATLVLMGMKVVSRARIIELHRYLFGALALNFLFVLVNIGLALGAEGEVQSQFFFFEPRPDISGTLLGVFVCIIWFGLPLQSRGRGWIAVFVALVATFGIAWLGSRAAILATFLCFLLQWVFGNRARQRIPTGQEAQYKSPTRIRLFLVNVLGLSSLVVVFAPYLLGFPNTAEAERLAAEPRLSSTESTVLDSGDAGESPPALLSEFETTVEDGTSGARLRSWWTLAEWLWTDQGAFLQGVGFGYPYLEESGAKEELLGSRPYKYDTQDPHNFVLSVWAELGLIYAVFFVGLILLAIGVLLTSPAAGSPVNLYAGLLGSGLLFSGLFGVVIEAPFGAIPIAWVLGQAAVTWADKNSIGIRRGLHLQRVDDS